MASSIFSLFVTPSSSLYWCAALITIGHCCLRRVPARLSLLFFLLPLSCVLSASVHCTLQHASLTGKLLNVHAYFCAKLCVIALLIYRRVQKPTLYYFRSGSSAVISLLHFHFVSLFFFAIPYIFFQFYSVYIAVSISCTV